MIRRWNEPFNGQMRLGPGKFRDDSACSKSDHNSCWISAVVETADLQIAFLSLFYDAHTLLVGRLMGSRIGTSWEAGGRLNTELDHKTHTGAPHSKDNILVPT